MTRGLGIACDRATAKQRFHLRSKTQGPPVVGVVQRFDPEGVPCEEQSFPAFIPERECIHASKRMHHILSAIGIKMEQDFGVAVIGDG